MLNISKLIILGQLITVTFVVWAQDIKAPTATSTAPPFATTVSPGMQAAAQQTYCPSPEIAINRCVNTVNDVNEGVSSDKKLSYGQILLATPGSDTANLWKLCMSNYASASGPSCSSAQQGNVACQTAETTMHSSIREFSTACGKAKMGGKGGADQIACSKEVLECHKCKEEDGAVPCSNDDESTDDDSEDNSSSASKYITFSDGTKELRDQVAADSATASAEFKQCHALAKEGLKSFQDEVKEARDKIKELQQKVSDDNQALSDMDSQYAEDSQNLKNQATEQQNKATDAIREIADKLKSEKRQAADQISKIRANIIQLYAQRDKANVQQANNVEKQNEYYAGLLNDCHQKSLQRLDQERAKKLAEMNAGNYSSGYLSNLLRVTGLDSRAQAQKLANYFDQQCQRDPNFKRLLQVSMNQLAVYTKTTNAELSDVERQITENLNQISVIQGQLPQDAQESMQEMAQKQQELSQEQQNLQAQLQNKTKQYTNNRMIKQKQLQNDQHQLEVEQDYLSQKQTYLAAANKYAHGSQVADGAVSDAMEKFQQVVGDVETYINSCCWGNNNDPSRANECKSKIAFYCNQYAVFNSGADCPFKDPSATQNSTNTTASPAGGGGAGAGGGHGRGRGDGGGSQ